MGCCSCLGFLLEPIKSVRSFHGVPDQLLLTDGNEDGDCFLFSEDPHERHMKVIKSRPVCRLTPVKETRVLILDKDEDCRKIVNEYIREHTLRVGSLCKVVLYRNSKDGKQYAVKAFYKSRLMKLRVAPSETAMTDVLREVSIMKMVEHPNIVNLIEVIDDPDQDHFYMVLEYVEGDCICEGSGPPGGIGDDTARGYFRDVVAGLMYLHAHNIVHGDIKPENLLVTSSGRVKIADFGVSHVFEDDNDELRRSPGTPVFTAPECCSGLTYHGKAADTWALGVTLYCLLFGQCPFIGDTLQETFDKIVNDPLPLPKGMEPDLKNLLEGLLCKDPRQRFRLSTVAGHPWVLRGFGPIPQSTCRCKS
ncbi:unnamed protein product [Victoria cruziana]